MKIIKGTTRIVFIFKNFVIKIPNGTYSHLNFLNGCYANWSEWQFCKNFEDHELYQRVAPSLFCIYFGLLQIQQKCDLLNRELTDEELDYFREVRGGESKPNNFGFYKGRIVCLDYP